MFTKQYAKACNEITNTVLNSKENVLFSPYSYLCILALIYSALDPNGKEELNRCLNIDEKVFSSKEMKYIQSNSLKSANALFSKDYILDQVYPDYKKSIKENPGDFFMEYFAFYYIFLSKYFKEQFRLIIFRII